MAAGRRRAVLAEHPGQVRVARRSYLLLPDFDRRPAYDDYVIQHRRAAAARAPGLDFTIPRPGAPYPRSSLPAARLAILVQDTRPERLEALEDALFRASFAELADVADPAVLERCARAAELEEDTVERALADETLAARALEEHADAVARGLRGIPTLLVPGAPPLTGAVPVAAFRAALAHALG